MDHCRGQMKARSLNRRCDRRLDRYTTRMLGGARRPNHLAVAIRVLNDYIRMRKRSAKQDPDHFDYSRMHRNHLEDLRRREWRLECEAAIQRVYGPQN